MVARQSGFVIAADPFLSESEHVTAASHRRYQCAQSSPARERIRLVASAECAVVFGSLVAQCVPVVCDSILIDIAEGCAQYRLAYPPAVTTVTSVGSVTGAGDHLVRVPFTCASSAWDDSERTDREGTYLALVEGVATFGWHSRAPAAADRLMAAALIDQAVGIVSWQQSELCANAATRRADNLHIALQNSRRIGAAIGIVMTLHKITETQAFDLLRAASQHSHRKLRDVAEDVCHTGTVDFDGAASSRSAQPRAGRGSFQEADDT